MKDYHLFPNEGGVVRVYNNPDKTFSIQVLSEYKPIFSKEVLLKQLTELTQYIEKHTNESSK